MLCERQTASSRIWTRVEFVLSNQFPFDVNLRLHCYLVQFSLVWFVCVRAFQPLWVIQCQNHHCWKTVMVLFNQLLGESIRQFISFPKVISPKVNVIARLEFELAYYDIAVKCISHNTTRIVILICYLTLFDYVSKLSLVNELTIKSRIPTRSAEMSLFTS